MQEMSGVLFYLSTFLVAFAFGFPVGPSSLEMLRLSAADRHSQAWILAFGVASADALWAMIALVGLLPWMRADRTGHKGVFFLLAAAITFFLAWRAGREKGHRREKLLAGLESKKMRISFWKGTLLGISYPLTFGSWIATLAFFKKFGWRIPKGLPWIVLFFAVVFLGYFSYLALLQSVFLRFRKKFSPRIRGYWQDAPVWLMLVLAVVFLVLALTEIFRHG